MWVLDMWKNIVCVKLRCDPVVVQLKALVKIYIIDSISNSQLVFLLVHCFSLMSTFASSHLMQVQILANFGLVGTHFSEFSKY